MVVASSVAWLLNSQGIKNQPARLHAACMPFSFIGRSVARVLSPAHRNSLLTSRAASQTSNMSQLLSASPDRFDGIIVDETKLPDDVDEFKSRLSNSIKVWQQQQKHGVWIKVPMKKVALISAAVEQGFQPHHAEPAYFMLTRLLPDTESTLPPNASHQVGVGSFVVNGRDEVLVVQEKYGTLKGKGLWKLPTGLVLAGEDLPEGAEREAFEETGVRAKFQAVLGVRQMHRMAFGKSDLFFICGLRTTSDDQELIAQPTEVDAVKWMPMDEYVNSPLAKSTPLYGRMVEQCRAWAHGLYAGLNAETMISSREGRTDLFIYGHTTPPDSQNAPKQSQL